MALSGLQSRLHTIHQYTFPPSSAEVAAAELVRLYVQKGHSPQACHRFLKKRRRRRPVCVSPPGQRVSFLDFHCQLFHQQGHTASMTYRVQRSCGHGWEGKADHLPVPALNTPTPMVHPAAVRCFHVSSCYHPQTGFSATFSSRAFLQLVAAVKYENHFVETCADFPPYR